MAVGLFFVVVVVVVKRCAPELLHVLRVTLFFNVLVEEREVDVCYCERHSISISGGDDVGGGS